MLQDKIDLEVCIEPDIALLQDVIYTYSDPLTGKEKYDLIAKQGERFNSSLMQRVVNQGKQRFGDYKLISLYDTLFRDVIKNHMFQKEMFHFEDMVYNSLLESCLNLDGKDDDTVIDSLTKIIAVPLQMKEVIDLSYKRFIEDGDFTIAHQARTMFISYALLSNMGARVNPFYFGSHDFGKNFLPSSMITKPGEFTSDEWTLMKQHPLSGALLLSYLYGDYNLPAKIALFHHERLDGSGYPFGIKEIPEMQCVMITIIGDVIDAMKSKRPYKKNINFIDIFNSFNRSNFLETPVCTIKDMVQSLEWKEGFDYTLGRSNHRQVIKKEGSEYVLSTVPKKVKLSKID